MRLLQVWEEYADCCRERPILVATNRALGGEWGVIRMTDSATHRCSTTGEYSDVFINGTQVMRVFGPTNCSRAASAASALNAAFAAGDDFEFCTPSWYDGTRPYAVVTVISAKTSNRSTWYAHDKRLIVAATSDDSPYPWWTALRWARNIRDTITQLVNYLYLPPNYGTTNDGSAYTNKKGSNYGNGETLNQDTSNLEVFHTCDLTVATNVYTVPSGASRWVKVTYPTTGKVAVLRVNDYGPNPKTGRSIDFSFYGGRIAIGSPAYVTDTPVTFQFQH